jgi:hypothetical protein
VRLRDQEAAREAAGALEAATMEVVHGDAEAGGVAADLVEREHAHVAVEGGVLDSLGHDRRGGLLEAADELRRRLAAEQQLMQRIALEGLPVGVLDRGDVRAVYGQ